MGAAYSCRGLIFVLYFVSPISLGNWCADNGNNSSNDGDFGGVGNGDDDGDDSIGSNGDDIDDNNGYFVLEVYCLIFTIVELLFTMLLVMYITCV